MTSRGRFSEFVFGRLSIRLVWCVVKRLFISVTVNVFISASCVGKDPRRNPVCYMSFSRLYFLRPRSAKVGPSILLVFDGSHAP